MAAVYGIAQVERLLKVKAHTIRYWEQEIPLVKPRKDFYGRRLYGDREIQLLLRVKHLVHERRFTIEGAREQLYRELSGDYQDIRAAISALRAKLLDIYFSIHEE
ncbi:MAG: MerR family transcriptional regulator [Treponematales bacterium]|jgi:DNA-binding transcriptional MerR regulator